MLRVARDLDRRHARDGTDKRDEAPDHPVVEPVAIIGHLSAFDAFRDDAKKIGVGVTRRERPARQVGSPAALRVDAMARSAIEAEVSFPDVDGCRVAGERIGLGAKKSGEKDGRKK